LTEEIICQDPPQDHTTNLQERGEKMERVGYDLDGTLCEKIGWDRNYRGLKKAERDKMLELRLAHFLTTKMLRKPHETEFYIITGRKEAWSKETLAWLEKQEIKPVKVYFMQKARCRKNMVEYKSEVINELKLTKYYEDDRLLAKELGKRCPNTKIILVPTTEIQIQIPKISKEINKEEVK